MKEIEFESRFLISTKTGETPYHDDMLGEDVWISFDKPNFIHSYDWREFNGIQIKKIAELLEKWNNRQADIDMKGMKDLIDSR